MPFPDLSPAPATGSYPQRERTPMLRRTPRPGPWRNQVPLWHAALPRSDLRKMPPARLLRLPTLPPVLAYGSPPGLSPPPDALCAWPLANDRNRPRQKPPRGKSSLPHRDSPRLEPLPAALPPDRPSRNRCNIASPKTRGMRRCVGRLEEVCALPPAGGSVEHRPRQDCYTPAGSPDRERPPSCLLRATVHTSQVPGQSTTETRAA